MIALEAKALEELVDYVIQRMNCGDHGMSKQTCKESVKQLRAHLVKLVEEVEDDAKRR